MHRVLFITDDWDRKKPLKSELLEHGFALTALASADVLKEDAAFPKPVDVVIIDLESCATQPSILCRTLKRELPFKDLPLVLLVTEPQLRQLDFGWGIEDYLTLPVTAARLIQRLKFLLWKLHRASPPDGFALGGLVIDVERYEVRVGGEPIDVTYKEFELLKFLAAHPGKAFTREELLNKVWGYDYYGGTRTVDVHIRRLRSKIELGGVTYIDTVRNVGYKFLAPKAADA